MSETVNETMNEYNSFLARLIASEKTVETVMTLTKLAVILIVGLVILKVGLVILRKTLKTSKVDPVLHTFIVNSVKGIAIVVLMTMCLGTLGVQMSTIIAVIGAAGAAIALALKEKETPAAAKILAAATVAYALSPIDLIPDFIPVLGHLDDLIILPAMIALTVKRIPAPVLERCRVRAQGMAMKGKWYHALPITVIWLGLIALILAAIF